MSHIASVKKLLSDDLKGLIKEITGFQEGSQDFKKCEDKAWSTIIDRYHPSVNERQVKSTIYDFVYKFKVHGFPQKAQNLSMLIDAYSKHPYFQGNCSSEVQWGLIDFLIKLSIKPTNCKADDPPLDLSKKVVEPEEEPFDWPAYLKEGYEKFRLPSEDGESLSDWSDDEVNYEEKVVENVLTKPYNVQESQPSETPIFIPPPVPVADLKAEAQKRKENAENWLKSNTQDQWWNNEALREIPKSNHPETNACFQWEKATNSSGDTRVLSEYKVLRELIYVLARPTGCYFIEENPLNSFKVTPKISISSLSPDFFTIAVEESFCKYLADVRKLQSFCSEVNVAEISCIPATYRSYSVAVQKILNKYYNALLQFEKKVDAQNDIVTIYHLFHEISPFLDQISFLTKLHEKAIPPNWREMDLRTNAFSLLCSLYDELKYPKKWIYGDTTWPVQNLLILFLESFYPFLKFLAQYMTGYPPDLISKEFFLSSTGEILVEFQQAESSEFWKPVLQAASAAISSCSFLMQLGKQTNFFYSDYPPDILFVKVVQKIYEMLFYEPLNLTDPEPENDFNDNNPLAQKCLGLFDDSFMGRVFKEAIAPASLNLFKPTVCDRLSDKINETDLSTSAVGTTLKNAVKYVIEEYMEPKGFASEILLEQLKLLDHLNALYSSLQVTSVFSTVILIEFQKFNNWKKIMWFSKFENCLLDVLPHEYVQNFRFIIDRNLMNDISIFDLSDYIQLSYKTKATMVTLISEEVIAGYSQIFSFLLKTRITLGVLNKLLFQRIEENENNTLRIRRLCSLRLWFLHVINTINFYFSTYNNFGFIKKMKELCLNERNLCSILKAHEEFVENWKHHCFVSSDHPCHDNVLELISLSAKLNLYYKMEQKGFLADYHLDDFEQAYIDCMRSFACSLRLFDERLLDKNDTFSFLYDEVINNLPAPQDPSLP